ncbi:MAG: NAD(P)H-hydrate dehydratase [Oscillospiraceae bacterium]|nr:NAD(P)H-hydrate dehydratase [Oscillospiraceae bacterium]
MERRIIPIFPSDIGLPVRKRDTHKSDYGKLLILGGSVGYTGAVSMCARAAIRSGAGLVSVGVPEEIYPIIAAKLDEPMPFPLKQPLCYEEIASKLAVSDVCIIGPGLGRSEAALQFARDVLKNARIPVVVDADALFAVKDDLHLLRGNIITPHAGEFARLGGVRTGNPAADAAAFADAHGCITVLKGPETAIAFPHGKVYLSRSGNPGMAVGGSGDVLAGIIGGLLGQLPVEQAVTAGVCIHGGAGDLCAARMGEYSMTPSDMIEALPAVMKPMIGR